MKDLDKLWVGLVEENKDPDRIGRIKVRVQTVFDDIPLEDIPWAHPIKSINGKSYEVPSIGKIVSVFFPNDNLYEPYYMYSEHYNVNLQKKLDDLSDDEYVNFKSILFDHITKIYSSDDELTLDHLYNKITINNDNINLELKDNNRKINIGSKNASQQAVLGNHFFDWMDKFVQKLSEPTSLIGNMSSPILKPEIDLLLVEYRTLRETFVSDHIYLVDDMKIDKLEMKYNSPIIDDSIKINDTSVVNISDDDNSKILSDKIIEQKNKELDKIKESIPSDAINDEHFIDVPENNDNNSTQSGEIEKYYEIKDNNKTEITKQRYDEIKNNELTNNNINVYESVNTQEEADEIFLDNEEILISSTYSDNQYEDFYDYDSNVYVAPDDSVYMDKTQPSPSKKNIEKAVIDGPSYEGKGVGVNCNDIVKNFSPRLKISKHYTLGEVAVYYDRLKDKNAIIKIKGKKTTVRMTKYQLACNLKSLAVNILDKIKDRYPDMVLNSTIRNLGSSSEHETGQAADMRFPKHKKKDYILIANWIKQNLPYNQLFLEYRPKENPKGGWIHVSYQDSNNVVYGAYKTHGTLYNDSNTAPGSKNSFSNPMAHCDWT